MKKSRITLAVLFASFIVTTLIDTHVLLTQGVADITFFAHAFFIGGCAFIWCKQHALENGLRGGKYYALGCALILIIGVPVYAYGSYGFKRGSIIVLKAVAFAVLASIATWGAYSLQMLAYS